MRRTRCGTCWTRSTPCALARLLTHPSEQAVVPVSAERASGDACGAAGRTLRQESGARTRWAARTGRPSCRMGRCAARREATADLDARAVGRGRPAGEAGARDVARRASRLATGVYILFAVGRTACQEPAGRRDRKSVV